MALNDTYRIIKTTPLELRPFCSFVSKLEDIEEGDIYFHYCINHIAEDEETYTTIDAYDKYNAQIKFYIASDKLVNSYSPIRLGTYRRIYNLYFEYTIKPLNSKGVHETTISFLISRI